MILGFLFVIQTFLKHCKALSTEKYKRDINILLLLCRSMKLWNAVHIMSSIGRKA